MKTTKTIWVAQDRNTGEINAFEEEPQLYGVGDFWIAKRGHITPMLMFSTEIRKIAQKKGFNLELNSMQMQLTIELPF